MAIAQCDRRKNLPSTAVGAWAELLVTEILLMEGFHVFRNVSPHGEHDLVVMRPGDFTAVPVDVTLGYWNHLQNGTKTLTSPAAGKMRSGKKFAVLVVTQDREIFIPRFDYSKGKMYLCGNGWEVVFEPFTVELFSRWFSKIGA